jgi:hypothetical protein
MQELWLQQAARSVPHVGRRKAKGSAIQYVVDEAGCEAQG